MQQAMIETMNQWIKRIPAKVWFAVGCLLVAAFWVVQHDSRIRQQARLQQVQQQTAAEVAALKKQAEQEVNRANVENAKAIEKIEARRLQMEQQNQKLAAQLDTLRTQARVQAEQVATLPIRDVVTRVAAQLGLKAEDVVNGSHGTGVGAVGSSFQFAKSAPVAPSDERTPHPVARAAALSPGRGLDRESSADNAKDAMYEPPAKDGRHGTGVRAVGISSPANPRHKSDAVATNAKPASPTPVAIALTGSGARKVETALVELKACQAESSVENQQIANCQSRAGADDAIITRQAGSIASLNQALQAKDKILGQQASECKAELRTARGTFLGRLARVTEHIAIGVAMGVAIGMAAR
jgi:hypothetical protein